MGKNDVSLLIALLALTISGCTSTANKKKKRSSLTPESSSVLSSSKQGTSNTSTLISSTNPTSESISSESTSYVSSQTQTSSGYPSSSAPYISSAQPTYSSATPTPSSSVSYWSSGSRPTSSGGSGSSITPSTSGDPVINEYYSSINSSDSGETLKTKLMNIVKNGHTKIEYSKLADCMTFTDRDWNKSPNKADTNPYMHIIYLADNENKPYTRSDYTDVWDKEHIWAKYNGDFEGNSYYSYSDLHHLRASDKNNNNRRSNHCFKNLTLESGATYVKDGNGDNSGLLSSSAYMPQACDRGDVARALFYMATRYADGSNTRTPLSLSFEETDNNSGGVWGHLETLLEWHEQDPVDEFERNRNNMIYTDYQHNRNPFIDHPEYARRIWSK